MKIGIIGSGNVGSTLAKYLINLGHEVIISNSRGPASLTEVVEKTGAIAGTVEEAAAARDLVIIAIPEKAIPNLPVSILSISKAIIIHSGNYYPSRDGRNIDIENGLTDSEWVAKVIGHPVIKAFNNIVAGSLVAKALPKGHPDRIALSVAGDNLDDKHSVMQLIDEIGFDAIDAGAIASSWRQQPGEPAYCRDLDKQNLIVALGESDINKRTENLALADEIARPYF
ncbi:NAD(P)-binding domain-containing protein [Sphingobacterium sp. DR205]|uniref:NADPH-dependent F420 reductase n=1 Tax=Sphingobacterium sp. DR205 TaxID=2713573 RepID=UPI0013E44FAD|nr:NAD(P)-binding domain-containing protein [Sphingobacterium sp. DR205]QIH34761.1 NAD(P)-binding domain-containing protein [Sphingobacterium sp. DR205]